MRQLVSLILGVVVVIAAVGTIWMYARERSAEVQLVLLQAEGGVRLYSPGESEAPAFEGRVLSARDRLATEEDGRVVLGMGRETRIRVGPTSALRIQAVDEQGVRLELEGGALQATVRPDSGAVRVSNRRREVVAINADFQLGVRDGVLQVGATRGSVALVGVEDTQLDEGQQATLVAQRSEIGPIPDEVLLDVRWPPDRRTRSEWATIQGQTAPGARVSLQPSQGEEVVVTADGDGNFRARVPLAEGENPLAVTAVDVLGQEVSVRGRMQIRDTRGPGFRGGVQYGQ